MTAFRVTLSLQRPRLLSCIVRPKGRRSFHMNTREPSGPTDAAALAGATLAAAVSNLMGTGPFDWLSGILGVSLLLIVLAFEGPRGRSPLQTVAFSAVTALAALLPVALVLEHIVPDSGPGRNEDGRLGPGLLVTGWIILGIVVCYVDWKKQRQSA